MGKSRRMLLSPLLASKMHTDPETETKSPKDVVVDTSCSSGSVKNANEEKRLVRKIDMHVIPMLFLIYFVAFLDRVNISNALTMSLPKDLGLTGQEQNIILAVFFVPYVVFEIPSNILMRRFSPHIWMAASIGAFGVITICQGFVQSYGGIVAVRFLLGLTEAGIFPGSFYIISMWYKVEEAQRRFTVYWSSLILAGALGSLIATGIAYMNGIQGLANWRWIFILEGIATVLVAIATFFLLSDFPAQAKWLSEEEKELVRLRTHDAFETERETITVGKVFHFLKQPHVILGGIMYFSIVVPVYSFSYFTPTIIATLGYSLVETQVHSSPPFWAALATCLVTAWLSDKIKLRYPFVLGGGLLMIIGLALLVSFHGGQHFSVEYLGLHFTLMGALSAGASIVCWYLMNLRGHMERSIGSAWMISFGNIGGIVATFAFLKADAPYYRTGYVICISFGALGMVAAGLYMWLISNQRRKLLDSGTMIPSL